MWKAVASRPTLSVTIGTPANLGMSAFANKVRIGWEQHALLTEEESNPGPPSFGTLWSIFNVKAADL